MFAAKDMLLTSQKAPIIFDAVGAGGTGSAGTMSWSHIAAAGADVEAFFTTDRTSTITAMTCAGTAMTLVGSQALNNSSSLGILYWYRLSSVTAGTKTIAVTTSGGIWLVGNSVSYLNVHSVGTPASVFGSGTAVSQAQTCLPGQMIVHAFVGGAGGPMSFSAPTGGTLRANNPGSDAVCLLVQDSTASATFGGTLSTGTQWAGIGGVLS
jgi:hypothetical protein